MIGDEEKKMNIIMLEEHSLAREVALGIIIMRPLKAWLYIIPGMFIVDFLRRGKEIRQYGNHFMFPRKLALEAVQNKRDNINIDHCLARLEERVVKRLNARRLFSEELKSMYRELLRLLIDHYEKLIKASGNTYADLVRSAYEDRGQYESFLNSLLSLETNLDNALAHQLDSTSQKESLLLGLKQLEIMRKKHTDEYF